MIKNKKDYTKGFIAGIIFIILMDILFKFMYDDGSTFSESIVFGVQLMGIIISEHLFFTIGLVITIIIAYFLVSNKFIKIEEK